MTSPTVHPETPHVAVACGAILGEGALWDQRSGTLFWVDIKKPAVWRWQPGISKAQSIDVPESVGFVALTPDPDVLIAGFKSGLARFRLSDAAVEPVVSPEPDKPGNRINDGHVGPDGTLYFGTMDDDEADVSGSFWRWDGRQLTEFGSGIAVTNGPATSPDGRTLYATHTKAGIVFAHSLVGGAPGPARPVIRFEDGWGHPDGFAVDAEGHLWICHWGASRITRFAPDGTVERIVPIPTAQVTKCAFGGPNLTTLYVTTAAIGRDPHIDPMAGHVFAVETGIKGQPAYPFIPPGAGG